MTERGNLFNCGKKSYLQIWSAHQKKWVYRNMDETEKAKEEETEERRQVILHEQNKCITAMDEWDILKIILTEKFNKFKDQDYHLNEFYVSRKLVKCFSESSILWIGKSIN